MEMEIRNSVSEAYGADGRLLSRTLSSVNSAGSPYLAAPVTYSVGYDSVGHAVQVTGGSTVYWQAGAAPSIDPLTGPYDALGRLSNARLDSGAVARTYAFAANSNLPTGYTTTVPGTSPINIYSAQNLTWQGSLRSGYTVTSNWEGAGTEYAADYDVDGHLRDWSAAPLGALGSATQQFNETYSFALENLQSVAATNNLGLTRTSNYGYDLTSTATRERVTSVTVPSAPVGDSFDYDRRGRGLIIGHRISASQTPAQDSYEYDADEKLISISRLGSKLEDLAYGPDGELAIRTFTNGTDTARYYVGDHMTLVRRGTTLVGYAHIYLGSMRIASAWSKTAAGTTTTGTIYYHRNDQGSVVATTTAGGQVGISYRYLPSGAVEKIIGTEADENASELGFTGGLKLSGGLIHLKARAYSPLLRRFLQADTLDQRRYTYASGDPLNFLDPTGRKTDTDAPPYVCNDACRHAGTRGHDFTIRYWVNPTPTGRILIGIDSGDLKPSDPISKVFTAGFVPNASERTALNGRGMSNEEIDDRIASADVRAVGQVVSGFGDMWHWVQQHPGYAAAVGAVALVGAFVGYDYLVAGGALAAGGLDAAAVGTGAATAVKVIGNLEDTAVAADWGPAYEVLPRVGWTLEQNFQWLIDGVQNGQHSTSRRLSVHRPSLETPRLMVVPEYMLSS